METNTDQNQIIIKMNTENEKKMLPVNFLVTLANQVYERMDTWLYNLKEKQKLAKASVHFS